MPFFAKKVIFFGDFDDHVFFADMVDFGKK